MKRLILAGGILAVGAVAWAQAPDIRPWSLPDPQLTPGAVASTSVVEVCAHRAATYSEINRQTSLALKNWVAREYGVASRRGYEIDHLVPLCSGGADVATNLWPQPINQARVKDRIEAATCRAVCEGRVPLALAQTWFMGDWRALLGKEIGR